MSDETEPTEDTRESHTIRVLREQLRFSEEARKAMAPDGAGPPEADEVARLRAILQAVSKQDGTTIGMLEIAPGNRGSIHYITTSPGDEAALAMRIVELFHDEHAKVMISTQALAYAVRQLLPDTHARAVFDLMALYLKANKADRDAALLAKDSDADPLNYKRSLSSEETRTAMAQVAAAGLNFLKWSISGYGYTSSKVGDHCTISLEDGEFVVTVDRPKLEHKGTVGEQVDAFIGEYEDRLKALRGLKRAMGRG